MNIDPDLDGNGVTTPIERLCWILITACVGVTVGVNLI